MLAIERGVKNRVARCTELSTIKTSLPVINVIYDVQITKTGLICFKKETCTLHGILHKYDIACYLAFLVKLFI